jgi:hypothetical protein
VVILPHIITEGRGVRWPLKYTGDVTHTAVSFTGAARQTGEG